MDPVAEACEECTVNCQMMHKRHKNPLPSATATTFFKVMIGDDFSKILYLPPRFSRTVRKKVGKTTELENFSGEKFEVHITKVDGGLAFQKGWSEFVSAHGLKVGDLLVFHYVMDKHFVVLMYGDSGCPELRHYQMETKKNNTCDHFSHESSSQPKKRMKEKETDANMLNIHEHLVAASQPGTSGSVKEKTVQRSKLLFNDTNPDKGVSLVDNGNGNGNDDNMVFETPIEKRSCLVDNYNGNKEDERRKKDNNVKSVESGSVQKNSVCGRSGGGVETKSEFKKGLEKRILEKQKENNVMRREAACSNSSKRSRDVDVSVTHTKIAKKEPETSGSKLHNGGCLSTSNGIFPRPEATHAKIIREPDISDPRLHNVGCVSPSARKFHKPEAAPAKSTKKDSVTLGSNLHNSGYPTTSIGNSPKPTGSNVKDAKMAYVDSHTKESGNNLPEVKVKPEPVDYDEALASASINISFSAVMTTYQYLELPECAKLGTVKVSATVIFLKNSAHMWPVLYQTKLGLKALTQCWGTFARETGIQVGDECLFVPEMEPNVFTVHTSR